MALLRTSAGRAQAYVISPELAEYVRAIEDAEQLQEERRAEEERIRTEQADAAELEKKEKLARVEAMFDQLGKLFEEKLFDLQKDIMAQIS